MEKLNRKNLARLLLASISVGLCQVAMALSTDKDQPIEVEADYAELDDKEGVTIYEGNVIVTQGSMRIDGDRMVVTYNEQEELDTLLVTGKPAHYRQMPDGGTVPDEAEALTMEYHALQNMIILINEALVKQEGFRFTGNRIEYDTENSKVFARSSKTEQEQTGDAKAEKRNERVKLIIEPKKKN